jgi:hypothetical protein
LLILISLYLGSCGNNLNSPLESESPEASAVLMVSLRGADQAEVSPRTLVPTDISGKYLRLTFTPETEGLEPVQAETQSSSLIVRLAPGTWQILAQGWSSKGDWETAPDLVILRGAGTVQVKADEVLGTQVLLYPLGTGTGTFKLAIQVPGDTVSGLLRVYPLPENPDSLIPALDLYAGRTSGEAEGTLLLQGSLDLPGGFYRAALDLSRHAGDQVLNLRKSDTVHIYDSLTTTGAYTFTPEQFVPGEVFTDLEVLQTYLGGLLENTPDTPYLISLKVNLSTTRGIFDTLSRYVALDLRGSTGDMLSGSAGSGSGAGYLVSIVLPEGVETLGEYTFAYCSSLEYVSLPESLKTIGNSAFRWAGFSSIRIPHGVRSLGDSAFADCTALQGIDLSGLTLESLGERAFQGCSSLEQAILPGALPDKTVPDFMFYQCTALESVNLPKDIESIGSSTFGYCASLRSLELPATIKTIGHSAFNDCSNFDPDIGSLTRLETIAYGAFQNCGIKTLQLPASLSSLGQSAFQGCAGLTLAEIPESLVSQIDYLTFAYCRDIQFKVGNAEPSPLLVINGVLRAYPGATGEVSLPEGIREIAGSCFRGNTGITGIILPASLATIGGGAFSSCSNLKDLVCLASSPPSLGASAFQYHHADLKIYVLDTSVEAYKGASNWSDLAALIYSLNDRP